MKTKGPLETKQLENARDMQFEKYLHQTDRAATEQLAQSYRGIVPDDRIKAMKDLPTKFENRQEFDRNYRAAGGHLPECGQQVMGFSRRTLEPAHVATDHLQIPKAIIHERLHQSSAPEAKIIMGTRFYEGVTEDLAIKQLGIEPVENAPKSYPEERAFAHKVREVCGDRAIEKLYFQGDAQELRQCLDKRLGPGSLDRLRHEVKRLPTLEVNTCNERRS